MEKTIFKYKLEISGQQTVMLPRGAKILTVQAQNDIPVLWALVSNGNHLVERIIEIYGTGHPIELNRREIKYISTFQCSNGFVGHVFEKI